MTMRLPADEQKYTEAKAAGDLKPIHQEPAIQDFEYWRIVDNRFPHTRISDVDHLLVLKREAAIADVTAAEWSELLSLYSRLDGEYDVITHNFASMRSVQSIPHFHLYKLKVGYK